MFYTNLIYIYIWYMGTIGISQVIVIVLILVLLFGDLSKIKKKLSFRVTNNSEKTQKNRKKGS